MTPTTFSSLESVPELVVPRASDPPRLPTASDGRVRFTRDAYHRMAEAGLFGHEARYELIDGEIFMMSPIGPRHGAIVRRLTQFFSRRLPDDIDCSIQLPIYTNDLTEPEPDVVLVKHREDDYCHEHPSARDVLLLIEVSQSTLAFDLGPKLRAYAESGIAEYWIVDIQRQAILVHRNPLGNAYQNVDLIGAGGSVVPKAVPSCKLEIDWLFR
jgi:Uma2 family endonuclease